MGTPSNPDRSVPWILPTVIFVVCWTLTTHGKYSVSGDEPHYLMVAESLWADGDLDLRNNYAAGQSRRFGVEALEPGLHVRDTPKGTLLPVHDIGVPVTLLPVYVAATTASAPVSEGLLRRFRMTRGLFAYSLVSLFVIGLTTLAAAVTYEALVADQAARPLALGVVLAAWLAPPLLSNSFLVFPEPFALLMTAVAVRVATGTGQRPGLSRILLFTTALGLLPWFHRKYVLYGALLLCAVTWRQWRLVADMKPSDRALALACFLAPQAALLWWTWQHWGTVGGPLMLERAPFSTGSLEAGVFGLLVDRENGLFVWAPIYLLLPAAWWLAGRRDAIWLVPASSLFLLSAAHDQWWGGFSPAGRFLVPLVPLFALVGASAVHNRPIRYAALVLLIPQVLISAYGWQYPRALWPQGNGENTVVRAILSLVDGTDQFLPSLRSPNPDMTHALIAVAGILAANVTLLLVAARAEDDRPPLR
jgi:hypothetical protein